MPRIDEGPGFRQSHEVLGRCIKEGNTKIAGKLTIMVFILQSSLSKRRFHGDKILSCKASRYMVSASTCWSALSSAIKRLDNVTKFGFTPLFDERILS